MTNIRANLDLRLIKNFSMLVIANSGAGKTRWVLDLVRSATDVLVEPSCTRNILFFYHEYQSLYDEFKQIPHIRIEWINEKPNYELVEDLSRPYIGKGGTLLISDDWGSQIDLDAAKIVEVARNHLEVSSIFMLHNLYHNNPIYREMNRQTSYIVLFASPRDLRQIQAFASQLSPANSKWIMDAFQDATKERYGYLLFDFTNNTPQWTRIRTNFLPRDNKPLKIYYDAKLKLQ